MNFITTYFDEDDNTSDNSSCEESDSDDSSDVGSYEYDCPLIFIEEKGEDNLVDTRVYIYYNIDCNMYHIIGKRRNTRHEKSVPYSFMCKKSKDIISFLISIVSSNKINVELHTAPMITDVTFDYLSKSTNIGVATEIVAYDGLSCENDKYVIRQLLTICRHFKDSVEVENDI